MIDTVKKAAASVAGEMVDMYNQEIQKTGIPGMPGRQTTTWWVAGAMFMTLIQYWHVTGDSQYNNVTSQGMYAQKGEDNNYFPSNWSAFLSNDDQILWGLAAITAAEYNYPQDKNQPSWLTLAEGVFNDQVPRWDMTTCNGGMRSKPHFYLKGYNLKNAVSNGGLFQLSARLAYYTNNQTFADWANRIWNWSSSTPLLDQDTWFIADSVNDEEQCKTPGNTQWTYNYGLYVGGVAYMYNHVSLSFIYIYIYIYSMVANQYCRRMSTCGNSAWTDCWAQP